MLIVIRERKRERGKFWVEQKVKKLIRCMDMKEQISISGSRFSKIEKSRLVIYDHAISISSIFHWSCIEDRERERVGTDSIVCIIYSWFVIFSSFCSGSNFVLFLFFFLELRITDRERERRKKVLSAEEFLVTNSWIFTPPFISSFIFPWLLFPVIPDSSNEERELS